MLKATLVDDIRSDVGKAAGAIEFRSLHGEVKGIACRCPCGCGEEMWLPVRKTGAPAEESRVVWEWNGKQTGVVLSPSVFNTGLPCRWHGYLGRDKPGHWNGC